MVGLGRVFTAEAYRLVRSRAVLAAGLGLVLVSALRVVAAYLGDLADRGSALQAAHTAGLEAPPAPPAAHAFGPMVDGWSAGLIVGTLLLLCMSARSLAGDREDGLLRLATTRSATRSALVWGRLLLGLPVCAAVILLSGLGAWGAALPLFDFGPLLEDGYQLMSSDELNAELLRATLATFPPLFALWAFGLLISSAARTATGAVATALAGLLAFDLFKDLLGQQQYRVFAAYLPFLDDNSCMAEMRGVARGLSDAGYSADMYAQGVLAPWPQALVLGLAAAWILSRRRL